jgi:hypothetical protein
LVAKLQAYETNKASGDLRGFGKAHSLGGDRVTSWGFILETTT